MMDDETSWQDAALNANDLVGPTRPAGPAPDAEAAGNDDAVSAALADTGFDELESGIASIFAALQAANEEDGAIHADDDDGEGAALADAQTYALLSELDRLWQRPGS